MRSDRLEFLKLISLGLCAFAFIYVSRLIWVNIEDVSTSWFTMRILGLFVGLCAAFAVYILSNGKWLAAAIALTGTGLTYGLGINGREIYVSSGSLWDVQILWYYLDGRLSTSHTNYDYYVTIAYVSLLGNILTIVGGIFTLSVLERSAKELKTSKKHQGTNKYRSSDTVYGDADWGDWDKIKKTVGSPDGIVLGENYDPRQNAHTYNIRDPKTWGNGGKAPLVIMSPEFEGGHSLIFSGPGGGKTAGIVIPTCLHCKHSLITVDPEFDVMKATRPARLAMGRNVRVIKLEQGLDILKLLRRITTRKDQVFAHLARLITEPTRDHTSDVSDFFREEANNILAGLLNHFTTQNSDNPFWEVLKVISKPEDEFKSIVGDVVQHAGEDSLLSITLASYQDMDTRTFTSFQTTIKQALKWAPYKELMNIVSNDPVDAHDIFDPLTDVYIQISKSDLETYPGLIRLVLGTIAYVIDNKPDGIERLMIIDEAYQIGKLKIFEKIRDTARKKSLHLMQIFQTSGQLEILYGRAGVRAWNGAMAARIYSTTEDSTDQEEISKMIGEYTVDIEGKSKSSSIRGVGIGTPTTSSSQNTSLQRARLMRPEQLRTLPNDGLIIFFKGFNPIICGKALWFRRKEWQKWKSQQ